jgi:hypothetical protein
MFYLFGGDYFYPLGGMNDFVGAFSTLEEAIEIARQPLLPLWEGDDDLLEWWQVATYVHGGLLVVESSADQPRGAMGPG